MQWVLDGYLLTLGSLVLVGGALGDLVGKRRIFLTGTIGFAVASVLCGLAPNLPLLVAARMLQGAAAALLVPTSLALLNAVFSGDDRGQAIGAWSGLSGVFTALGPFVGGALVDAFPFGWRLAFLINVPLAVAVVWLARQALPDLPGNRTSEPLISQLDLAGAALATVGLGLVIGPSSRSTHSGCARGPSWPSAWRCWWRSSSYRRAAPGRANPSDDPPDAVLGEVVQRRQPRHLRRLRSPERRDLPGHGVRPAGDGVLRTRGRGSRPPGHRSARPVLITGGRTGEPVGSALVPHGGSDRDGARTHLAEHPGPRIDLRRLCSAGHDAVRDRPGPGRRAGDHCGSDRHRPGPVRHRVRGEQCGGPGRRSHRHRGASGCGGHQRVRHRAGRGLPRQLADGLRAVRRRRDHCRCGLPVTEERPQIS